MKTWLLPFFACAAALLAEEQGSPDVIRWEEEKKEIKVEETGRLEVFDRKPKKDVGTDRFADRVADPGKRFLWVPSPDPKRGAGGARIPDAVLSEDRSALILLETVGTDDGPFDTRLVVIDVRSGEIVRVTRLFRKERFVKLLTIPESDDLLLFSAPEKKRQTVFRVHPTGPKRGAGEFDAVSDALILSGKLLLKYQDTPELTCRSLEDLSTKGTFKTAAPGGFLIPESEAVVCNYAPKNPGMIERIAVSGEKPQERERFLPLPKNFRPDSAVTFGGETPMQLYFEPGGIAMLRLGQDFHPLAERSSGMAAYHAPSGTLFLGLQKQDMIAEFRPAESTNMLRSSLTGQRSPRTRGEVARIFCDDGKVPAALILDHRANVYRLQLPDKGRSWPKKLLFVPGE